MKKIISLVAFLISSYQVLLSQPISNTLVPRVDERFELLGIAFKLAKWGHIPAEPENPAYITAIGKHFNQYAGHPFIQSLKQIVDSLSREGVDASAWEIPSLAAHLGQPPALQSVVPFSDTTGLSGWDDRSLLNPLFVGLLKQFYREASCERFFRLQRPYFNQVNSHVEKQVVKINKGWLHHFFGIPPTEKYYAVISLQNIGAGDYIRVNFGNNRRNTFTIFGCESFDEKGIPHNFSSPLVTRSSLHEYIHAFTNQLVDEDILSFKDAAQSLLANESVWQKVQATFYNTWEFLVYESMVRACTIKYLSENPQIKTTIDQEIAAQEKAGFVWIRGLVQQLDRYESEKKQFRNLRQFMPEIRKYFKKVAGEMGNIPAIQGRH